MTDAQDRAEALDGDQVPDDYPPDEPWGVDEPEVTAEGEWAKESFEERTERTDDGGDEQRPVIQPYADPRDDVLDVESQAVADAEPRRGDEYELPGHGVPAPAEEAALHIEE
jgi:hypothetical protein